ncbi:MAG: diacylglycerol kinase family lipid kinase [Chlorobi bacterium]|nr:diacylglycerol kinase family lipid kinase [Chlorobiota bacterium]
MNQKDKDKWIFIINPVAGNGFAKKYAAKIEEKIVEYNVNANTVFTERKGHATELAKEYANNGFKYIIGVGGDGTLNEISAALVNNKNVAMGIVPAGTGNDFIQILGFPNRFDDEHWKIFFEKSTILMDVGSCNGVYFVNGMGLGFDAQVASENYTKDGKEKKGGKDKYLWHIIKTILFYREKKMRVVNNGQSYETECFINTVSIGRRFAGSFFLTPNAIANDGMFDVCQIKRLSLFKRFDLLLKVPKGTHINDKKVNYYQTNEINLDFPVEVPFHVDGEMHYSSKFHIKITPQAINAIYNPYGNHYFKN